MNRKGGSIFCRGEGPKVGPKKIILVSRNVGDEKNLHPGSCKISFFNVIEFFK